MTDILIVDDEPAMRKVLERILTSAPEHRIHCAANAGQAREILANQEIHLVLTDVHMPGESGLDLARFIKAAYPQIGIVLVTVIADPKESREALDIGLYGYILKPFDGRQVRITVANALRRRELEIRNAKTQFEIKNELFEKKHQLREMTHEIGETRAHLEASNHMLHEQLIFFQSLLEAIPHPVYYNDLKGIYLGCNAAFEHFLACPKKEIIGKNVSTFASTDTVTRTRQIERDLLHSPHPVTYESSLKNSAGRIQTVLVTKALYADAEGEPTGIVTNLMDISDRKESELALRASEAKVRQIIDNLNVGVVLISSGLELLEMNRQIRNWFPSEAGAGRPLCYEVLHSPSQQRPCTVCPVQETLRDGKVREVTTRLMRLGKWCDFRTVCSPIYDNEHKVVSVITLFEDVTERKAMERELVQSQKMASIGQLAAGVAHEINNPTGFVSSNLKTLDEYQKDLKRLISGYQGLKETLKDYSDPDVISDFQPQVAAIESLEAEIDIDYLTGDIGALIAESREGTERIKRIVEDLKRFAHPGQDKVQDTDINAGLNSTLNIVNNELKYKATVIRDFGELPIISANPQQLNQVFANILVNAAQAIDHNGEICIKTQHIGEVVEIRISDTGCGIAEENLEKIFDPFFTTKAVGNGTGLGMNIVYNIIQKHNGTIKLESRPGVGTTFIIHLPVYHALDEETHEPAMATNAG